MTRKEVLIIIPAYNEEKNLGDVLSKLQGPPFSDYVDVLVVNDGSFDATANVAREYGVTVISNVYNMGYGSALQLGYKYACRHRYPYVIQMDGDGQHDVCNIERIYKELKSEDADGNLPDIVLGGRFMEGSSEFKTSLSKKIAYTLFRGLIRLCTGNKICDPTTGLQGLNQNAYTFYSGYKKFDDKFPDANMITQMMLLGYNVREIPAVMHQRLSGKSMHSGIISPIIYMIRMTLSILAVFYRVRVLKVELKAPHVYDQIQDQIQ